MIMMMIFLWGLKKIIYKNLFFDVVVTKNLIKMLSSNSPDPPPGHPPPPSISPPHWSYLSHKYFAQIKKNIEVYSASNPEWMFQHLKS